MTATGQFLMSLDKSSPPLDCAHAQASLSAREIIGILAAYWMRSVCLFSFTTNRVDAIVVTTYPE